MEPQDNRFIKDVSADPTIIHSIKGIQGPSLHDRFDEARQTPHASTLKRARTLIAANIRDDKQPPSGDVYEQPVASVCDQFALAARAAIQQPQCELTLRAKAAALARELKPSLRQADEAFTVEAILDIAVKFDQPRQRTLLPARGKNDSLSLRPDSELEAASF